MQVLVLLFLCFSAFAYDHPDMESSSVRGVQGLIGFPVGAVMMWDSADEPSDEWLECDGRPVPDNVPLRAMMSHTPNYIGKFLKSGTREQVGESGDGWLPNHDHDYENKYIKEVFFGIKEGAYSGRLRTFGVQSSPNEDFDSILTFKIPKTFQFDMYYTNELVGMQGENGIGTSQEDDIKTFSIPMYFPNNHFEDSLIIEDNSLYRIMRYVITTEIQGKTHYFMNSVRGKLPYQQGDVFDEQATLDLLSIQPMEIMYKKAAAHFSWGHCRKGPNYEPCYKLGETKNYSMYNIQYSIYGNLNNILYPPGLSGYDKDKQKIHTTKPKSYNVRHFIKIK